MFEILDYSRTTSLLQYCGEISRFAKIQQTKT
jgi:hypothetical protein